MDANARADLGRLRGPVLVISATRDRLLPRAATKEILAARPDAQVVSVDAPHLVLQTAPAEVWRAIERFWAH